MASGGALRRAVLELSGCASPAGAPLQPRPRAAGYSSIAAVSQAAGVATSTIWAWATPTGRASLRLVQVRRAGGGRKPAVVAHPGLIARSEGSGRAERAWRYRGAAALVRGSPRQLANELQSQGHQISRTLVGELLHGLGFSLQANARTSEGFKAHPDQDAQFAFIDAKVEAAPLGAGEPPVISVDAGGRSL